MTTSFAISLQHFEDAMNTLSKYSTLLAFIIASIPPFFFATPLFLKSTDNDNGFYGIAIWSAAVLGGFAFIHGVDFTKRSMCACTKDLNIRTAAAVLGLIFITVLYSYMFRGNYPIVTSGRPDFLIYGILMFMALRGLEGMFVHGVLQGELFVNFARPARVLMTVFMAGSIFVGFVGHDIDSTTLPYFAANIIESLFGILLFEMGLPLYAVIFSRMMGGAIFIWFMQLYLF